MAILLVQVICSVAVIWYFHVKKVHPGNVITTAVVPALGGIGMLYVVYLLFSNLSLRRLVPRLARCSSRSSRTSRLATFVVGLVAALWLRANAPRDYEAIGRTVLEEAHERV